MGIYFRQQTEMAMPDVVIDGTLIPLLLKRPSTDAPRSDRSSRRLPLKGNAAASASASNTPSSIDGKNRLSSLRPIGQLAASAVKMRESTAEPAGTTEGDGASLTEKRAALKELLIKGCNRCPLAQHRRKFVFGAGNAGAPVVVIGEAPGREEDEQGLPFVGAAGQLLTSMLAAINLNRSDDVFITNVLKCRPPGNRNPETAEITACLPLLKRQIEIIGPRALLLLGRIAANAMFDTGDSVGKLRGKTLDYHGIPAMVIYHPAALLRNAAYKRPAWEDLQQFQKLLSTLGVYGSLRKK